MTQLRILVAEDDVLVAEDLREALEEMGHEVVAVVHRADDVTRTAREKAVDLALLDIKMPGMLDGIDVGRRLRRELEIPVIFVTAYADDVTVRRAGASDPFGYLVKPVDGRTLHTAIEIAAQRHARERLLREALREMEKEGFEGDDAPVHYRALFRERPAAIAISALSSGRILDVNRRFQDLFGWDRHESVGETLDTLGIWSGEKDRDRIRELVESDGRVRRLRTSLRNREGDDLEVDLSAEILALGTEKALLTSFHDVTERAAAEVELERMALYDTLTGLPNRNLFRDRLRHALDRVRREGRGVGVLFVDLDGFKEVNDTLGHEAGDEILELVAQRILGAVRDEDTVARLGGDEFTVILEKDPSLSGAEAAARRIRAAMLPPFQVQGRTLSLTASVGVAVTRNGEIAAQDLVHSSDMAMYAAKQNGGDGQSVLLPDRDPSATRSLRLNDDLTRAVVTDEIGVSYQPMVAMDTGRIVGAEALVRWDHPERGVLSPHILLASAGHAHVGGLPGGAPPGPPDPPGLPGPGNPGGRGRLRNGALPVLPLPEARGGRSEARPVLRGPGGGGEGRRGHPPQRHRPCGGPGTPGRGRGCGDRRSAESAPLPGMHPGAGLLLLPSAPAPGFRGVPCPVRDGSDPAPLRSHHPSAPHAPHSPSTGFY